MAAAWIGAGTISGISALSQLIPLMAIDRNK
jgi:hypothetical protein